MRRRRLLGFLAAGTMGLAVASSISMNASAIEAPGSGFLSLNLQARAGGLMVDADKAADQAPGSARGGVPFTEATASGFNSRALSSIAWPGALGGNVGKLLTLAPVVPYGAARGAGLLLPARLPARRRSAERRPDRGQHDRARCDDDRVRARGGDDGRRRHRYGEQRFVRLDRHARARPAWSSSPARRTPRSTRARTSRTSSSSTSIIIGSVTSIAHVTTDGLNAAVTGRTEIADMKITGTPVTIDGAGIHVADQSAPLDALTKGVHDALRQRTDRDHVHRAGHHEEQGLGQLHRRRAGDLQQRCVVPLRRCDRQRGRDQRRRVRRRRHRCRRSTADGGGGVVGGGGFVPTPPGDLGTTLPPPVSSGPLTPPGTGSNPVVVLTREVADLPDGLKPLWVMVGLIVAFGLSKALVSVPGRMLAGASTPCPLEGRQ